MIQMAALVYVIAIAPAVVGLAALGYGLLRWQGERALNGIGHRVTGRVTDSRVAHRATGRMVFHPVVRFQTLSGQDAVTTGSRPSRRSFIAGAELDVVYDPMDPGRADVAGTRLGPWYAAVGAASIGFGVAAFLLFHSFASLSTAVAICPICR
ncbi:DUF3592 domain-containing protein [Micromonospora sp. NBC_01813]|uniref:DUF3592 domain-containing protein n=1 Tax=Micromonospora sp. NBC_01813 TaxID=2975988 RepID=UPI002DDB295E|nr:DUF3592 domain-containing protein [Micromonospora sp. NBC_01813]WSA07333.1 DUF3592 domain-containing protein [Micromonospora sp. NBC_01813]